jgi:alanine racemase
MTDFTASSLPPSRCWAEIDTEALRHNVAVCQALAGDHCGIMAIVKADAYGHGLKQVVAALAGQLNWFGVANVREALRAREAAGDCNPHLLILSPATPGEIELIIANGFSASISTMEEVRAFSAVAKCLAKPAKMHAVADTGMGRMGCPPAAFPDFIAAIRKDSHCLLEGIDTHFPSADEDENFTRDQIEVFRGLVGTGKIEGCEIHLNNSAGLIGFHDLTPFATLARPGLAIYGISPLPGNANVRPVMSLKTRVSLVREIEAGTGVSYGRTFLADRPMTVATLAVGYGDGYTRLLSGNGAEVLIAGRRCPLLGRVTMDQIVVDISHLETVVQSGDEVVLIGHDGDEEISVVELAEKAGTIPWEILTGITNRVERIYR